ncbi:AIR synthase [Marmoricola endophyticus]|uniref:AIR synthase n=1 Tax=Marmoricola endophyticus TaxID=2040280 RepID=A0A917BIV6_9ACTN|nr:MSMEG_0567/sll0787 family protein [Marmoricola endophyticus]GGF44205.1 AIR synthase [Marmoricola endophyticus]
MSGATVVSPASCVLTGPAPGPTVVRADPGRDAAGLRTYAALRHRAFVESQGLFEHHDLDDADTDPRTVVLLSRTASGVVVGGVRLHPVTDGRDLGWWQGSRLVVAPGSAPGTGTALVRAACATAEDLGALRFEACVQARHEALFTGLGWQRLAPRSLHGVPHVDVRWPVGRVARLVAATKSPLAGLVPALVGAAPAGHVPGFLGDDGAPLAGTDVVAACDAILPSMVERDPEWAGWCAALVNLNDLGAMGATPVGLLDAVGARDAAAARRVLHGLAEASRAWAVPVLGGHTQLGVPASLSVTALGRTTTPVPGGGGRPGHRLRVTADLGGGWRPGYAGTQWDSSSHRTGAELRALGGVVRTLDPAAAKDVSMGGLVGTLGMLAEASGCGAVLDAADVPTPGTSSYADWVTCFPGFAMLTAHEDDADVSGLPGFVTSQACGELTSGSGVRLRWPDGEVTEVLTGPVTGLGAA